MNYLEKYGYLPTNIDEKVAAVKADIDKWQNKEVYAKALGMIDLTSLTVTDTPTKIAAMTQKVNKFSELYPDYPLPASICVYPNFAKTIAITRDNPDVHVTVVGGCFPASQSFLEVKVFECVKAVNDGADEVDIVLALNSFLDSRFDDTFKEISEIKKAITSAVKRKVILKVILETGALGSYENIAQASFLAMEAGADFIKTSTGKTSPSATPEAAYIMCECISKYMLATARKVGFKPAGGIATAEDAALYYGIVDTVLGEGWLSKEYFRFGASRMANNLLGALEGEMVKYY
ncbi:MAG: deoxyribose-phosphate aldolase [Bacteroidales bacterium]|nr:deoxyribose-phosphate aldolase [Bacteroidales bacterium]